MQTFSKLDEGVSKRLLQIAGSEGFLDFSEADVKLLDTHRKVMYGELQSALGPSSTVVLESESYGESAEVIVNGKRLGSVEPNCTLGEMDYHSDGGQVVRLTSPATARLTIMETEHDNG